MKQFGGRRTTRVSAGDYMADQMEREPRPDEVTQITAVFDMEEFVSQIERAKADKRWRTDKRLAQEIEAYCRGNNITHHLSQSTIGRLVRGKKIPDVDDLLILAAVFERPEGIAYFIPRKPDA